MAERDAMGGTKDDDVREDSEPVTSSAAVGVMSIARAAIQHGIGIFMEAVIRGGDDPCDRPDRNSYV